MRTPALPPRILWLGEDSSILNQAPDNGGIPSVTLSRKKAFLDPEGVRGGGRNWQL